MKKKLQIVRNLVDMAMYGQDCLSDLAKAKFEIDVLLSELQMDAKTVLKNMTRKDALTFIGDLIQCELIRVDYSGINQDLEDAYFHIDQASETHTSWINRERSDDDAKVEYLDMKRREAGE